MGIVLVDEPRVSDEVDFEFSGSTNQLLGRFAKLRNKSAQQSCNSVLDKCTGLSIRVQTPTLIDKYPKWTNITGAIPNLFLRSAIFGIGNSKKLLIRKRISGPAGFEIFVTGSKLTVNDLRYLDVLFQLANSENTCRFTPYSFLKRMQKTDTGENYKALKIFFSRVMANSIEIIDRNGTNQGYEGSIVVDKKTNENTGDTIVMLNPQLRQFFQKNSFTLLNMQIASEIRNHQLAFWLFGYYSTHAQPFPLKVQTIHELCGSESENIETFTQCLKRALGKIKSAYIKNHKKFEWSISKGLVTVSRTASVSQNKSIAYKKIHRGKR